jgi:hypothetical protein
MSWENGVRVRIVLGRKIYGTIESGQSKNYQPKSFYSDPNLLTNARRSVFKYQENLNIENDCTTQR